MFSFVCTIVCTWLQKIKEKQWNSHNSTVIIYQQTSFSKSHSRCILTSIKAISFAELFCCDTAEALFCSKPHATLAKCFLCNFSRGVCCKKPWKKCKTRFSFHSKKKKEKACTGYVTNVNGELFRKMKVLSHQNNIDVVNYYYSYYFKKTST